MDGFLWKPFALQPISRTIDSKLACTKKPISILLFALKLAPFSGKDLRA